MQDPDIIGTGDCHAVSSTSSVRSVKAKSHPKAIRLPSLKIIPEAYDDADFHVHPMNTHGYPPLPCGRKKDGLAHL